MSNANGNAGRWCANCPNGPCRGKDHLGFQYAPKPFGSKLSVALVAELKLAAKAPKVPKHTAKAEGRKATKATKATLLLENK